MNIGICDDSRGDRQHIKTICEEIAAGRKEELSIREYNNAIEFIQYGCLEDILILDIEMQGMTGIELKNKLQMAGKDTLIIFVTDHSELVLAAFGINVFGFVEKSRIEVQLRIMLENALDIIGKHIVLDGKWDSRKILFIKAERVYCSIYLDSGEVKTIRKPIREMETELEPAGFIRTHRSYLVNAAQIEKIDVQSVYLCGYEIPVATRLRKKVQDEYNLFCRENARFC